MESLGFIELIDKWEISCDLHYITGLVHDCSNSIANAMGLLQSCTKLSIYIPNILSTVGSVTNAWLCMGQARAWSNSNTVSFLQNPLKRCLTAQLQRLGINWLYRVHSTFRCHYSMLQYDVNGSVQDCIISSALAMEIPQSCTKPSIWYYTQHCSDWIGT